MHLFFLKVDFCYNNKLFLYNKIYLIKYLDFYLVIYINNISNNIFFDFIYY